MGVRKKNQLMADDMIEIKDQSGEECGHEPRLANSL